jgi:hypothetical protein
MRPDRIWRATRKIPPRRFHLMIHGRPPFARLKAALATSHPLWCELGGGLGGGGRVGKSQHHYFTDGSLFPATEIPAWVSALSRRLRPCLAGRNQPARSCWMPKLIGDTGSAGAPPAPASTVPRPAHPTPRGASCGGHQQLSARCGCAPARKRRDGLVDDETFRRNLVDMFLGALSMSTRISPNPPMCDSTSTTLVWSA